MKNEIEISASDICPVCADKRKGLTLPYYLEGDEKQEGWVLLTASICDTCGQTTIHMFHPEMFTTLPIQDKNEKGKLASGSICPQVEEKRAEERRQVSDQVLLYSIAGGCRT